VTKSIIEVIYLQVDKEAKIVKGVEILNSQSELIPKV